MSAHGAPASHDPIDRALAGARGVLPDQGPIGVFVHHNTLHAFQHQPFHDGVQAGAALLGARPYLSLGEFRAALDTGRIAEADVAIEIARALGSRGDQPVLPGLTRAGLWHTLLTSDCDTPAHDAHGLAFAVEAGTAIESRDLPRWLAALARVTRGPAPPAPEATAPRRHVEVLTALGATDTDVPVHGELVRLGSGFLDHGQAAVALPARERGFLQAVAALYAAGAAPPRACRGVDVDMRRVAAEGTPARQVITQALAALGVGDEAVETWLGATALALAGWAGMFARLERHPGDHPGGPPTRLEDFLAVRLLLEQHAVRHAAAEAGLPHAWPALAARMPAPRAVPAPLTASLLWHVSKAAALTPEALAAIDDSTLGSLWVECRACSDLGRRRIFQDAYERTYRRTVLDAVATRRAMPAAQPDGRARAQFVFCIDEREESIRRAIEEQHPGFVTYGAAGFFGVAIDYQGLYDREPAAYCPVVVTPGHEVYEQPIYTALSWHAVRKSLRDAWLTWVRTSGAASRTLTGGAGLSFLLGPVSAVRTIARVVAPRASLRFSDRVKATLAPRPATRLSTVRLGIDAALHDGAKPVGFSLTEAVDRVTATLTNLGLRTGFAPIVVFLGHGSTSLNNPHESAHDCGACGGRRGGANARLFADMANRPDVREGVRQRGIDIPADTWFIGALHDTADDSVRYYDLDALPGALVTAFEDAFTALERARRDNALERCRRFDDAPLTLDPDAALEHVEGRSSHLAQPRPEYGHCTNAICIVGRRELTRGLHLDRRAFLVSYDPTDDPKHAVVERILAAVGPVGAGISLEYYFSSVDNERFGCGTKLPHNVTGLMGVMNGHQGDLRTGLPLQMVELHEPMRLLLIVDASPEALLAVAGRQAEVAELVVNQWVQLVSMHPETGALMVFEDGGFVPYVPEPTLLPVVEQSREWHQRTRAFVPPALVRRALPASVVGPGHHGAAGEPVLA